MSNTSAIRSLGLLCVFVSTAALYAQLSYQTIELEDAAATRLLVKGSAMEPFRVKSQLHVSAPEYRYDLSVSTHKKIYQFSASLPCKEASMLEHSDGSSFFSFKGADIVPIPKAFPLTPCQAVNLESAIQSSPSVHVAPLGGFGAPSGIFIRGLSPHHSSLIMDGRRLNLGFSGVFHSQDMNPIHFSEVSILAGSQSVRYGSQTIGGVITFSSSPPKRPSFYCSQEFGSHGLVASALKVQYVENKLASEISLDAVSAKNDQPNSKYQRISVFPKLYYLCSDVLSWELISGFIDSSKHSPGSTQDLNFPLDDKSSSTFWIFSPGVRVVHEDWNAFLLYSYFGDILTASDSSMPVILKNKYSVNSHQLEACSNFEYDELSLSLGTTAIRSDFDKINALSSETQSRFNTLELGSWGAVSYCVSEGLSLNTGLRATYFNAYANALSYDAGLIQKINPMGAQLGLRYSRAISAPRGNDRVLQDKKLKPEACDALEASLEFQINSSLNYKLTVFYNELHNLISYRPSGSIWVPENIDKGNIFGVENTISSEFNKVLRLSGSYVFMEARDGDGSTLPRRAAHTIKTQVHLTPTDSLCFGAFFVSNIGAFDVYKSRLSNTLELNFNATYYVNSSIKTWADVTNVLDQKNEHAAGYPASGTAFRVGLSCAY